jgi:hypothetical protein
MSEVEAVEPTVRASKRRAESEDEEDQQEPCKRERLSPELESDKNCGRLNIDEAIKALDRVQYELNMGNIPFDSPESSDHDTPPESEDESAGDEMLSQAHALGFAACIRETFRFLDVLGINEDDPIYQQLKSRFVGLSN